jgi:hypothetical protein
MPMPLSKKSFFYLVLPTLIILSLGCMAVPPPSQPQEQLTSQSPPRQRERQNRQNRRSANRDRQRSTPIASTATTYAVDPQRTDKAIDDWLEPHNVAIDRSVPAQKRLFLFFSGSNGEPSRQRLIVGQAASLGLHAINLRYPNSWSIASLCGRSPDRDCHEKARLEILDGVDRSPEIAITPANSIDNRLVKLLHYLDDQHPEEGWREYLDGNHPRWPSIVVAGHSQGGGQAAIIAKQHQVDRVVMLGAPADFSRDSRSMAPWIVKPGVTPPERYYGFVHVQDPGFRRILQAWEELGMAKFGAPVKVDNHQPPYQHSHQLTTDATPAQPQKYHGSVATDGNTPRATNGRPLFEGVWTYLITGN